MRGLDYRTKNRNGLALLIASPLSSERAFMQALGRVGRYDSSCKRFILRGTRQHADADVV